MESPKPLKLPRPLETDPRRAAVEQQLSRDLRPIWPQGSLKIAHVAFTPALEKALIATMVSRQLERGLEHIEKVLRNEEPGLAALRERQGTAPAYRTSRLLVMADEGTERFYRSCEALLLKHGDRVLGLRVAVPCARLAQNLFGEDKLVKVLLVSEKDAVTNVLLSLVAE